MFVSKFRLGICPSKTCVDLKVFLCDHNCRIQQSHRIMSSLVRTDLQDETGAANLAFNEKIRNLVANGHQIHHLGFGQSPFPVLEVATEALKNYTHKNGYMAVAGIRELREVLSEFHERYDGLTIHSEDIIVGPGSKELLFLLFTIFNGDIMLLSPSWTTYRPQAQLSHHKPVLMQANMQDEWRLTPSLIEQAIEQGHLRANKLLVLCNPDNPTGTSYSPQQLKELAVTLRQHKILVVTDEIYGRLAFSGQHTSLATYYPEGTIVSTGFSKWASAGGWRVGYHMYPPELRALRDAVRNAGSQTYSCAPAPMQYAICSALNQPAACDEYMQHTRRIMKAVAHYCHKELTSVGVKAVMPTAGYYIFPDFELLRDSLKRRGITTCRKMCQLLMEEASVAVMAGGPDFLRPPTEFTTRLCYVDFDGSISLAASRDLGLQCDLAENFVKEYCGDIYEAIQCLKEWVLAQLKE